DVVLARDVAVEEARVRAEALRDRATLLVQDVEERDLRAFVDERAGDALALPARGARDDRDLACETTGHQLFSGMYGISYGTRSSVGTCTISIGKPSGSRTTQHSMPDGSTWRVASSIGTPWPRSSASVSSSDVT